MQGIDNSKFAQVRSDLLRDYAPVNAQERLLVGEAAEAWRRLHDARRREQLFFDLQVQAEAVRSGKNPEEARKKRGAEVVMWLDRPHKAYDQILRAIRDSERAFNNAIKRIEEVQDRRLRRERLDRKEQQRTAAAKPRTQQRYAAAAAPMLVETPLPSLVVAEIQHPIRT